MLWTNESVRDGQNFLGHYEFDRNGVRRFHLLQVNKEQGKRRSEFTFKSWQQAIKKGWSRHEVEVEG